MNLMGEMPGDEILLHAMLRIAREEGRYGGWEQIEPAMAATWERLRRPTSPEWEQVADRVRACCRLSGILN